METQERRGITATMIGINRKIRGRGNTETKNEGGSGRGRNKRKRPLRVRKRRGAKMEGGKL